MPFNVNEFIGSMPGDGARPNLFEIQMVFPPAVGVGGGAGGVGGVGGPAAQVTFKCRAASIPGSTLGTVIAPYFGREIKLAGNRTFEDWTITVMMDEDYVIRNAFEQWSAAINSHVTNVRLGAAVAPPTYMTDLNVLHFGKAGIAGGGAGEAGVIGNYTLNGAWPVSVEPVQLDWAANDQLAEFSVTFAYQWWSQLNVPQSEYGAGAVAGGV